MLDWLVRIMITSMIFFPSAFFDEMPRDYGFSYEEVSVRTRDGVPLFGWFLQAKGEEKGVILFFHGNAGNISHRLSKAKGWVERGLSVFLIDYRGYGKSGGAVRHQDDITKDAEAALDWVRQSKQIPDSKIILYGESLGTYPAIQFAGQGRFGALILESTFTSFEDFGRIHYGFIPKGMRNLLLRNFEFPNNRLISEVHTPVFVIHGTVDTISPVEMAQSIFVLAPGPKQLWLIPGAGHNDIPIAAGTDYWEKTRAFFLEQQRENGAGKE
jgi:fermentation-respiration switch protein FrsA (DUF1100 family)